MTDTTTPPNTPDNLPGEAEAGDVTLTPERAAHLRALNEVKGNYDRVLRGKYLSRTHGDQKR